MAWNRADTRRLYLVTFALVTGVTEHVHRRATTSAAATRWARTMARTYYPWGTRYAVSLAALVTEGSGDV